MASQETFLTQKNVFSCRIVFIILLAFASCSTIGLQDRELPTSRVGGDVGTTTKLAPALRAEIERLVAAGQADQWINIVIRITVPLGQVQRAEFKKRSCEIRSIFGNIVTARAPVGRIKNIAGLDFVVSVDLSKKVFPK